MIFVFLGDGVRRQVALAASHRIPRPDDGHATGIEGVGMLGNGSLWIHDYYTQDLSILGALNLFATVLHLYLLLVVLPVGIDPSKIGDTPESPFGNGTASI